jgi:hypothetical protein
MGVGIMKVLLLRGSEGMVELSSNLVKLNRFRLSSYATMNHPASHDIRTPTFYTFVQMQNKPWRNELLI